MSQGIGERNMDMLQELKIWKQSAQECIDKYYYGNEIRKVLGYTHYVKNNKLYRYSHC